MFLLVSSRSKNTFISLLRASTIGAGALFGRKMPNQDETSNFASSGPVSRTVGVCAAGAPGPRRAHAADGNMPNVQAGAVHPQGGEVVGPLPNAEGAIGQLGRI